MFYKHTYLNTLLLLHSAFISSGEDAAKRGGGGGGGGGVGDHSLKSHGNYIVDHGKSWKNHGIVILNFCGNPEHES